MNWQGEADADLQYRVGERPVSNDVGSQVGAMEVERRSMQRQDDGRSMHDQIEPLHGVQAGEESTLPSMSIQGRSQELHMRGPRKIMIVRQTQHNNIISKV